MQSCGAAIETNEVIRLGHGSGGRLTERLIETVFLPRLGNEILNELDDAAALQIRDTRLAFTTDSYVVKPLFFRGGDIGSLSVHGTVNDLVMRLARPLYLSASFIIEEGFSMQELGRIVDSFALAARAASVEVVAADTKVVERDAGDGVFINTTGIGIIEAKHSPSVRFARADDVVIVSGDIGCHGISILCAREELELETDLESDSASLAELVLPLAHFEGSLHCLRDLTRGGLSSALNEIAQASNIGIEIRDSDVPINSSVRGACELLGLDPLYVACEGRFVCIVEPAAADSVLRQLKENQAAAQAAIVGRVVGDHPGKVVARTAIGGRRIVDKLAGDQLPRIC